MTAADAPVHLVTGDDARLVGDAVLGLVAELVGDDDRDLLVDEWSGEEYGTGQVADSARTPPFLSDRRVVVARGLERFSAAEVDPLVEYLADPADSTTLVLEWNGGRVPKKLTDAVKACKGNRVSTAAPTQARARVQWLDGQISAAGITLTAAARAQVAERLGDDAGRLPGLLATLVGAYGHGARLDVADVEPFLGEAGGVPPWELTDPIDRGDIAAALGSLARMLDGGERHPLQVMATLHGHYERMLTLDGADAANEAVAADLLGDTSTFRARKTLGQSRRLGHDGIVAAYRLLASGDVDMRGRSGNEARTTLEILVARLSQLSRGRKRSAATR